MTIKDKLYFSYAGIKSTDYGIMNVTLGSGMQEDIFVSGREIKEVKIDGRDKPYFQSTEKEPLEFDVSFAFEDRWDDLKIREVARWLTEQNYYKELYFSDYGNNPERLFYALSVGDSKLVHNMLKRGYVTMRFRCDGPYAYSPIKMNKIVEWNGKTDSYKTIVQTNTGIFNQTTYANSAIKLSLPNPSWKDLGNKKWKNL